MRRLPPSDINYILDNSETLWHSLVDAKVFFTGATGFFGIWLLESFIAANDKYNLKASAAILSRNPDKFLAEHPWLKIREDLTFIVGDIRDFDYTSLPMPTHIIHAATDASAKLNQEQPTLMMDTIVEGTQHILDYAKQCKLKAFLFVSSGAVYGKQPTELLTIPESFTASSKQGDGAYAEGKRKAEEMVLTYFKDYNIPIAIARCFAFVGPYLPLDTHFAIGNFINDALKGNNIVIKGDGLPVRSYMYAADLTITLWTILLQGRSGEAYNVGSDEGITIKDLAKIVASCATDDIDVIVEGDSQQLGQSSRYVPNVDKAQKGLKLPQLISLKDSIIRTMNWYKTNLKESDDKS